MTLLVASCLWVLAGVGVAMLPMRQQYLPGGALILAAMVLIVMIGRDIGLWAAALAVIAFISMFRKPLRHVLKRVRRQEPKVPG